MVLKTLKNIFYGTYARGYFFSYLFAIVIGAFLLSLPISVQSGQNLTVIDALFTAASAVSVTGLTTIVVGDIFTTFGLIVLLFIIQFGGIGLIMLVAMFWLIARKKINFTHRNLIVADQNQFSRKGVVRFVRNVLIMVFVIEFIGFIIITHYLYFAGYFNYSEALLQGLFLAISLTANAGFDIAPNADSFQMFASDYFMQTIGIVLMFFGSVGFWVLAEVKEFIFAKLHGKPFKFSYFVKMIFGLHIVFIVVGALLILGLESRAFLADKGFFESLYYAVFMSITTRNAGFSTMDVNDFTSATSLVLMIWMFIGASPNSFGGGVRTTSILLVLLSIKAYALGRPNTVIFRGRRIKEETVQKAFFAITAGLMVVLLSTIIIAYVEPHSLHKILFEVTSAFGTTGLSKGITDTLTHLSKFILVIVMFIGRLGILAFLLMLKRDHATETSLAYPEEDIIVG